MHLWNLFIGLKRYPTHSSADASQLSPSFLFSFLSILSSSFSLWEELVTIEFLQATAAALFCVSFVYRFPPGLLPNGDPGLSAKTGTDDSISLPISCFFFHASKNIWIINGGSAAGQRRNTQKDFGICVCLSSVRFGSCCSRPSFIGHSMSLYLGSTQLLLVALGCTSYVVKWKLKRNAPWIFLWVSAGLDGPGAVRWGYV